MLTTSLILLAPSANKLYLEARGKALPSANNEALLTSLVEKALHNRAKFASTGRTKTVASSCEATPCEATLASPMPKKKALRARPKASQPNMASFQSPRVSVMDWLGIVNTDLRDYLSTKRKLCSEEPAYISQSQCEQAGCQFVMVHSVHSCLEKVHTPATPSHQSVFN